MKKQLNNEELNDVNGGVTARDDDRVTCQACGKSYLQSWDNRRVVGSGCDENTQYQCPHCGHWQ